MKQNSRKLVGMIVLMVLCLRGANTGWGTDPLFPTSDPKQDPVDTTAWPNQTSRANSDAWLMANHDQLQVMRPRLLLLNFSNQARDEKLRQITSDLISTVGQASRYHGYKDSNAPVFLQYHVYKFVDLREPDDSKGNSDKVPFKPGMTNGFNLDYDRFFGDEFAAYYGVADPDHAGRWLSLAQLVDKGYVHEVWFFAEHLPGFGAFECVELKPVYDEAFNRVPGRYVQAGNGGDPQQRWIGRSVRIGFINASRGIGCFLESLSHSFEGMANSGAIPYLQKYFREYAGFDLKERYGLPWRSLYGLQGKDSAVDYPAPDMAVVTSRGKTWRLTNYVANGGNVHFMPNGRRHYDLDNDQPALSTIEDWRIGSGPGGVDKAQSWTPEVFRPYRLMAPDCMGPWLVYWRQNFPGLANRQRDENGKPMKNWWPFLFY